MVTLISGCGMSIEEKERIAKVSCSIISETRNMDSAIRVERVNEARDKIGEEPFLDGDYAIKDAIEHGVCPELILNDPNYESLLAEKEEQERLALKRSRQREEDRRRQEKLERERKYAEAKRQRKLEHETFLEAVRSRKGKLLLDCDHSGSLLVDLDKNRIKRKEGYRKLSIFDPVEDSLYTRLTIREVTDVRVLFERLGKGVGSRRRGTEWVDVDELVIDDIELKFRTGAHFVYTQRNAENGGYYYGLLKKECSFQWSPQRT
tara:strand:- start:1527 stop:2315 length:789 start_codon:yes stop_codon:yes gene_type:complete